MHVRLDSVALGDGPADLVLRSGKALLPDGSIEPRDVAVVDDRIAALPTDASEVIGDATEIVDASGSVIAPGFVDAHTHLDFNVAPERTYHHSLAGGTTTVVSELTGFGSLAGARGVKAFLAGTTDLPLSVFVTVPPQPLLDTFGEPWADDDERAALGGLLGRERVVGVGEIDWIHLVGRTSAVESLVERAHTEGAVVVGHGAGCGGERLAAFATQVDNDHEAVSAADVRERVCAGIHVVGRSGSIRDDVDAVADAHGDVPLQALSLSTDGMWPRDLLAVGHMDEVVRRTIDAGVPPRDALRMASENPARHFGLGDRGTLAPGQIADVVVLSDLASVTVETVIAGGRPVVHDGEPVVGPRPASYPDELYDTVDVTVDPGVFRVPAGAARDGAVRAVEYVGGLLSEARTVEPPARDGELHADPPRLIKATVLSRRTDTGGFTGFLGGLGLERGAAATTTTWEQAAITVVGADDTDMHQAAEHVAGQGGGWAVVQDGEVLAIHPCPIAACMADRPLEDVGDDIEAVEVALRDLGVTATQPILAVATLTFFGVPALKLTPRGYADILGRDVVGLTPDPDPDGRA